VQPVAISVAIMVIMLAVTSAVIYASLGDEQATKGMFAGAAGVCGCVFNPFHMRMPAIGPRLGWEIHPQTPATPASSVVAASLLSWIKPH
jgi:hypothetical protein